MRKAGFLFGMVIIPKFLKQRFVSYSLITLLMLLLPVSALSEKASYLYDELGRLIRVVSESGNVAVYEYDEVGNLISIKRIDSNPEPPEINGIIPDIVFVGETVNFTISGKNLIGTREIFTDNPGIKINKFLVAENSIKINAAVSLNAVTGSTNFDIKTVFGSGIVPFRVAKLSFEPKYVSILKGTSAEISASIEGLISDYTVHLDNQNSDILSAPESITIPANEVSLFSIHSLKEGTGILKAENAGISIYVTQAFSGPAIAFTGPISVYMNKQTTSDVAVFSIPASVNILRQETANAPVFSIPVSVNILRQETANAPALSLPVSTVIEK